MDKPSSCLFKASIALINLFSGMLSLLVFVNIVRPRNQSKESSQLGQALSSRRVFP